VLKWKNGYKGYPIIAAGSQHGATHSFLPLFGPHADANEISSQYSDLDGSYSSGETAFKPPSDLDIEMISKSNNYF
jgi:hypothetical protein